MEEVTVIYGTNCGGDGVRVRAVASGHSDSGGDMQPNIWCCDQLFDYL